MRHEKRRDWSIYRSAVSCAVLLAALGVSTPAAAQQTREEEIAAKQRAKAQELKAYEPTRFERIMTRLEQNFASPPDGFYPAFGSVYPGGGLTPGVGYRRFFGRNSVFDIVGMYSLKSYKKVEVGVRTPWNAQGKWTAGVRAGWLDAPQIGYFGLGMDRSQPRTNFRLSQTYGIANATLRPTGWTRLEGEVAYEANSTDEGRGRHPSIETFYTFADTPGLFSDPKFLRAEGTAAIDSRPSPGYARTGGFYGVTLASFKDTDDAFSFQRLDAEAIQHIPILRENWVISLRARVQTTLDDADVVPYFLLPQLGNSRTLRGYSTGRFRDRHSLLTTAEFRWIPSRLALDMAVFYDAGKVTRRRSDLDFDGLASDWGIGARFHGPGVTVLRLEAARGSDGWRLVIATSPVF